MPAKTIISLSINMAVSKNIPPLAPIAVIPSFSFTSVDALLYMGLRVLKSCLMQLIMNYFAVFNYPPKNCCRLYILQGF